MAKLDAIALSRRLFVACVLRAFIKELSLVSFRQFRKAPYSTNYKSPSLPRSFADLKFVLDRKQLYAKDNETLISAILITRVDYVREFTY